MVYEILRVFVSLAFGLAFFSIFNTLRFEKAPFLDISYLGEVLVGLLAFSIVYYLSPYVIYAAQEGLRVILTQSITEYLYTSLPSMPQKSSKSDYGVNSVLLDTSCIIDGRIIGIVKQGFIVGKILIPQFVIDELHQLADNKKSIYRKKGRKGLDNISLLQSVASRNQVVILQTSSTLNVDKSLVTLAKKTKSRLITTDYNLNKVATIKRLTVLNINSLANELKTPVIPGETLKVKVIQKGESRKQGVGYLDDGTMVIVENGLNSINSTVSAQVSKVLQTDAGKIIFTHITTFKNSKKSQNSSVQKSQKTVINAKS